MTKAESGAGQRQAHFSQLSTIYSHVDSFNTPTPTLAPSAAPTLAGNSRASWGERGRGADDQGVAVYVRDHGHANYTVTRVIWA